MKGQGLFLGASTRLVWGLPTRKASLSALTVHRGAPPLLVVVVALEVSALVDFGLCVGVAPLGAGLSSRFQQRAPSSDVLCMSFFVLACMRSTCQHRFGNHRAQKAPVHAHLAVAKVHGVLLALC